NTGFAAIMSRSSAIRSGLSIASMACEPQFNAEEAEGCHSKQHEAVPEPADVRAAVTARQIPYRNINYSKSHDSGGKEKLEIAKWIEVAEIAPPGDKSVIVMFGQ